MSDGLAGGYPGAPNNYLWIKRNAGASAEAAEIEEAVSWGVYPLMGEDSLYVRWNGGGGFGDPLQREPERVAQDVAHGLVSAVAAREVYGVEMNGRDALDVDATAALRRRRRMARIGKEQAL
jgi:N-methylhydantoinase B